LLELGSVRTSRAWGDGSRAQFAAEIVSVRDLVLVKAIALLMREDTTQEYKAQQEKLARIGYLNQGPAGSPIWPHLFRSFRERLGELGYVEGQNLAIDYRFAEERPDRLPALVAELIGLRRRTARSLDGRSVDGERRRLCGDGAHGRQLVLAPVLPIRVRGGGGRSRVPSAVPSKTISGDRHREDRPPWLVSYVSTSTYRSW
jgi:hypothetical protein